MFNNLKNARRRTGANAAYEPPPLSEFSSPAVADSLFYSGDFMLGAGMVIFQPSTHHVVVVEDEPSREWFLPKGRKDVGESLEQAAVREAYEESGFRATPLPLWQAHHQPSAPGMPRDARTTEAFCTELQYWPPRRTRRGHDIGAGEYLISWYVGEVPPGAGRELGTGMPDEQGYVGHLLPYAQACERLAGTRHLRVLELAWAVYSESWQIDQKIFEKKECERRSPEGVDVQAGASSTNDAATDGQEGSTPVSGG